MNRRTFMGALAGSLLTAPLGAEGQQVTKIPRVGVFVPGSSSGDQFQQLRLAFVKGLRDLGWIEGQTVVIEMRWGEGRIDEFPRIASELVALPVDVIVA